MGHSVRLNTPQVQAVTSRQKNTYLTKHRN